MTQAGDADTNCAVAGALLGCKLGVHNIPQTWTHFAYSSWLEEQLLR
jgi:ADP-ribosylglycohydrolase